MERNRTVAARAAATLGTALVFLGLGPTAYATPLGPATTLAECVADGSLIDDAASCSLTGSGAFASGSLTLLPFVSLTTASTSGPVDSNFSGSSGAVVMVTYPFQIVGGNPGDVVPILISTSLTSAASSLSHAFGFAETAVSTSFGSVSEVVCTNGAINPTCPTTDTSFSGTIGWQVVSGETGDSIHVAVEAESGDSLVEEWANASADPFIFIDPSFAGAANYSVLVSPGVGNALPVASSVPEPGTFGLVGTALAMLGRWRRRR